MKQNISYYLQASLWIVYALLLIIILDRGYSLNNAIIKGSFLVFIQIGIFYLNSRILIPKLVENKKTWLYILYILVLFFVLALFFNWFERQFIPDNIPEIVQQRLEKMRNNPIRIKNYRQFINVRVAYDILSLLIILVISSAYSVSMIGRKKERETELEKNEHLQSEMKFLKSQINPHFLFNALNNIYSLTLTGSEKASEMILNLSDMLRYILYDCNEIKVPLENEWKYIEHFTRFQQLKSEEELNIRMDLTNDAPGALIAPMIMIPFVENAFKHSKIEDTNKGWITLSLNNKENEIIFQVENSIPSEEHNKDEVGGIGLENVKRRLELTYPGKYDLIINNSASFYSVILRIRKL